jgi:predicted ATPase/DNA-binding CsgD family transcriptional regulator
MSDCIEQQRGGTLEGDPEPERKDALILVQKRINNLPIPLSSFFGREEECEAISAVLFQGVRLLNLTGTGGVGKTRLALAVASSIHQAWTAGVCFVPLQAVSSPEQVIPAIAQALELRTGNLSIFEAVQAYLRPRHLLLVLDNFEQVVEAAPSLSTLLTSCQEVTVLVTSRQRLHVSGEREFPVLPLTVPTAKREYVLEELVTNPSVALFLNRAQAILPTFQLTPTNAQDIADICIHLEGLPLALELAAARIKLLPPHALLARLAHPLQILTTGYRDVSERQQTLRNTIQWSYDLLSAEEQSLFRRLCVFIGGCTLAAIEALYTLLGDDPAQVFDTIASLLDKSLLQRDEQEDGQPRFQMLETIREFGLECLQRNGEMEGVQQAHAHYYLAWAEASRKVLFGSEQGLLIKRYLQEQWNWRAAMHLLLERQDKEAALRLAGGLSIFWMIWGYSFDQAYLLEGKNFLEQSLPASKKSLTTARAWALGVYGGILAMLRNLENSEAACREGLTLARKVGDVQYIIAGLWMLLLPLIARDDLKAARRVVEEAVSLARELRDDCTDWGTIWLLGYSLHRAGYVALWQGRYALSRDMLSETITLCNQKGELFFALWSNLYLGEVDFFEGKDEEARERLEFVVSVYKSLEIRTQVAEAQGFLGLLSLRQGNIQEAHAQLSESLSTRKEVGDEQGIAWAEIWLARVEHARQNPERARHLLQEGLTRALKASSRLYTAMGLEELGKVVAEHGELTWAAQLFGAAAALREAMDAPVPLIERPEHEKQLAMVHAALGEVRWSTAWMQGCSMTPEQAFARQEAASAPSSTSRLSGGAEASLPRLTQRELEVLQHLSKGLTSAQIAEKLELSTVTISSYLHSIYKKLGVSSRTAALRFALDHHLL